MPFPHSPDKNAKKDKSKGKSSSFLAQTPSPRKKAITVFAALCGLGVLWIAGALRTSDGLHKGYLPAEGNLYTGVIVYETGEEWHPEPAYAVLGGDEHHTYDTEGQEMVADSVKLRHLEGSSNGTDQWWKRDSFRNSNYFFVKKDDPALVTRELRELRD